MSKATKPDLTTALKAFDLDSKRPAFYTGLKKDTGHADKTATISPLDGKTLGSFKQASAGQREELVRLAEKGFKTWRHWPATKRARVLSAINDEIKNHKEALASLMCLEMGKPMREARGEVDNVMTTFEYGISLARHIGGIDRESERPDIDLREKWHPLGPVLIITAFNFPLSLWAWNAAIATVCGNSTIWKSAPQTPLCSMAMMEVITKALKKIKDMPEGVFTLIVGDNDNIAAPLSADKRLPLVSATGSVAMGQAVGKTVGARLGRVVLELGGNAPGVWTPSADMATSLRQVFFSATLNGGQRCTALRRLLVHESCFDDVTKRLKEAYQSWQVGDIYGDDHGLPPLVDDTAKDRYNQKIADLKEDGVTVFEPNMTLPKEGSYVKPAIAFLDKDASQPQDETFGPLLYVQPYSDFNKVLGQANDIPQGLSGGIYSQNLTEVQAFIDAGGCDAGMIAINDNTGGLEVSLAFGGSKVSGIGSEKGSNSWQHYMRRQSVVINTSTEKVSDLGINFA